MTQAFNLSQFANNINSSGKADLTTAVTGTLPVANGGTGVTTIPSNRVMLGSGTSGVSTVATTTSGGGAVSAGMLLTYQGSSSNPTWESAPITGQNVQLIYTVGTTTWTPPAGVTKAIVWLAAGGGGGTSGTSNYGKNGGACCVYLSSLSGSYNITIGSGRGWYWTGSSWALGAGNSSSFATSGGTTLFSCTGGGNYTGSTGTSTVAAVSGVTGLRYGGYATEVFGLLSGYGNDLTAYGQGRAKQWYPNLQYYPGAGGANQSYVSFAPDDVYGVGCGGACLIMY